MKRRGALRWGAAQEPQTIRAVPTTKPSRKLYYSEEELQRLLAIWQELRNPGLRRAPGYIGQKLTFNRWLAGLTVEGAERALAGVASPATAPSSGTVERPMNTTPKTKPTSKVTEPAPARAKRGPKPGSGSKENLTLSLDKRVVHWLKSLPDGASPTANAILLRAYQRRNAAE